MTYLADTDEVFDLDVSVPRNPVTGTLRIVPLGPNGRGRTNRSDDGREREGWETGPLSGYTVTPTTGIIDPTARGKNP
jgi:hypothetical protein